jgi:hypothetical protein
MTEANAIEIVVAWMDAMRRGDLTAATERADQSRRVRSTARAHSRSSPGRFGWP